LGAKPRRSCGNQAQVIPVKDGKTRVLNVKPKSSVVTRSIQRVYPLEFSEVDDISLVNKINHIKTPTRATTPTFTVS